MLAEVVRSGFVESTHAGAVVALREDGSTALALGDVDAPVLPRSANKLAQAVGLLGCGWAPDGPEQLAIAASSHSGEPRHVEVVRGLLAPLTEADLGCPAQLPLDQTTAQALLAAGGGPSRLHMNCSGKHAAMLATCRGRGWPTADYLDPASPLQRELLAALERLAGEPVRHVAVDGCGAPQHALSLTGLARTAGRLANAAQGTAERAVADAVRALPGLVGGTGRDVTLLLQAVPGLLAKDGAEGVYVAAVPGAGAVALKVADGASRARVPVLVAALGALGVRSPALDALSVVPVLGGGRRVGEVRAAGRLAP